MSRIYTQSNLRYALALGISLTLGGCDSQTNNSEPLAIAEANASDFIALRVEAENFSALSGGWTLTNHDNIPTISPDPDPPHHQSASGRANMELLPDTRVTHDDELVRDGNFWGRSGTGPRMEYDLTIPEAGRYIVFVRAYSTGIEDNGIHVGFDNLKPASGERIQLCAGKNKWTWSSAQRVTTNHCGTPKTIFLDFPSAGDYTVKFYAREDGYELDQFLLLKENSDAIDCSPVGDDEVKCTDVTSGKSAGQYEIPAYASSGGNLVTTPPPPPIVDIDLDVDISSSANNFMIGDVVTFSVQVTNKDENDTATDVTAKIDLPDELALTSSAACNLQGNDLVCNFQELAPGDRVTESFTATVQQTGSLRIDARANADQSDKDLGNNTDSSSIEATPYIPLFDGVLSAAQTPNIMGLVGSSAQTLVLYNAGRQDITGAQIKIETDLRVTVEPDITQAFSDCSGSPITTCTLADLPSLASVQLPFTVTPVESGVAEIQVSFVVAGDEDQTNNTLTLTTLVVESPIVTMASGDLALEAENFHTQSIPESSATIDTHGWSVTAAEIRSAVTPDFDQGNFASASKQVYLEYLPDTRVGDADLEIDDVTNFSAGGTSAVLNYQTYFNEVGRYYINVRTRATNTEDATVHLGLDNTWPAAASSVTVCQPDGSWTWANGQLADGTCDPASKPFIDIETPGHHTLHVSTGTDGVEIDKVILRLNNSDAPDGLGEDPVSLQIADLDIAASSSFISKKDNTTEQQASGNEQTYQLRIDNRDANNTAYDITVTITGLDVQLASEITGFDSCAVSGDTILCKINALNANDHTVAKVDTIAEAETEILASAALGEASDTDTSNNSTVATPVGGGSLSPWMVLLLVLPFFSANRKRKVAYRETPLTTSKLYPLIRFINHA